jgi:predicted enzyme related to lactoylglutathione lyase
VFSIHDFSQEDVMGRVVHFEIPVNEPDRGSSFYQKVFGWKFTKWDGPMEYWMVSTGADGEPGINGGMMRRGNVTTTTNTVDVDSVDASVAAVSKAGGKLVMPKTPIPGVGYFAYCEDTEGNLFGVMQADPKAK